MVNLMNLSLETLITSSIGLILTIVSAIVAIYQTVKLKIQKKQVNIDTLIQESIKYAEKIGVAMTSEQKLEIAKDHLLKLCVLNKLKYNEEEITKKIESLINLTNEVNVNKVERTKSNDSI